MKKLILIASLLLIVGCSWDEYFFLSPYGKDIIIYQNDPKVYVRIWNTWGLIMAEREVVWRHGSEGRGWYIYSPKLPKGYQYRLFRY